MKDNPTTLVRKRAASKSATRCLLFSFILLFWLAAAASLSSAQESGSVRQPQAPTKRLAENQQSSTGKAGMETSRTGSITGRILGDDGRPVANATVAVFGLGAMAPPTGDTTDADGKFQIKDLRPGSYSVQAFVPGYIVMPDAVADAGMPRFYRIGESVNLTMVKGGVVTGTVTDSNGEPVIAAVVRAIRVRKPTEGQPAFFTFGIPRMTDDRGVYRIYGLEPGSYVIAVGGGSQSFGIPNAYEGNAPTYYPSATRDTAAELTVRAGEELTGIDVRYRGERGHTISGFVSGVPDSGSNFNGISVNLLRTTTGTQESFAYIGDEGNRSFALNGIADGDYMLTVLRPLGNTSEALMASRKISVRGADVTGLELKLEALGSLTGSIMLEPPPKADCASRRPSVMEEIVITTSRDEKEQNDESILSLLRRIPATPNDKGEFRLNNLRGGSQRLNIQLPADDWYIRSITMPGAATANPKTASQSNAALPGAFTLKSGERLAGLIVAIGQGAASLRGRVAPASEGVSLPARLRVHLVPVEPERATDLLRYAEAAVESDGRFALSQLAPGRYWLVARPDAARENEGAERRPAAFDVSERDRLRREAEGAGVKIDLQPCQRLADYVLNYGATTPKQTPVK